LKYYTTVDKDQSLINPEYNTPLRELQNLEHMRLPSDSCKMLVKDNGLAQHLRRNGMLEMETKIMTTERDFKINRIHTPTTVNKHYA
jgi:hypothetical protein